MNPSSQDDASPGGADQRYRTALAQGEFLIQRCAACARAVFYPRMICPHCGAPELDWEAPSGRGTVYSTTVVRRKAEAGGDYNVALVDLEEGVRMMSRVEGMAPDAVRIGMPVRAEVRRQGDAGLVVFVAREAA
ncbi:Zn-ribbon domain-containing OB-fold protein [Bordetella petrii]|uniref:Zn-ribbon domain-containing OB-fold protein n=1 Tax=Bordetella petrii TaxID=94624 RepID=UPI00372FD40C